MADSRPSIIVISGPTAAGKTAVALEVARRVPARIVCADSRQVYKMLDIGTAKPTAEEQAVCPHHLYSIKHPRETYNAGHYAADVRDLVENLSATPETLLLVGGTGLYIHAALDGLSPALTDASPEVREQVLSAFVRDGREALYDWLRRVDPAAAKRYSDQNPRRLQRALEYYLETGEPISATWLNQPQALQANVHRFVIDRDREELNQRIEERCHMMWESGLVEETRRVLDAGVPPDAQSLHTVGYTQALQYLGHGEQLSREAAIEAHITATRQYVKRQRTWFRKDLRYTWLQVQQAVDAVMTTISSGMAVGLAWIVGLVVALALLGNGLPATANDAADTTGKPPTKPSRLLSPYDSVTAIRQLGTELDALFRNKAYARSEVSCRVWNLSRDVQVYDRNGEQNLTPASTTKMFSTAAAFHALGPDGTLNTEVRATGRLLPDGTLEGDLYLVGMGDAMLTVSDLEEMSDELFAMGVRRVKGKVYGDGSFFDNQGNRAIYSGDGEYVERLPPVSALCINEGQLAVVVSASRKGFVTAQVLPASDAVQLVVHQTKASGSGKRGKGSKGRKASRRSRGGRISATTATLADGRQVITVSGNPGLNRTRTVYVAMTDPALICAGTLANRLRAGGVEVEGGIGVRRIPPTSRVLLAKRRTLVEFCSVVNKRSHNYFAEQVFKVVGGQYGGKTNTAEVAKQAMLTTLDSLKVPRRGCVFNDGSGLSRRNLVSAATETELLRAISRRKYAGEYYSTLAIAGVDGTIRGRMIGTPAENNVHAKTGTLRNTSALAGYVTTLDGERWCFSVISNGPYVRNFKATENRLATLLASFSYGGSTWSPPDNAPLPKLQDKTLKGLDPELESELELELELEPAPDTVVLPEDPPYEAGEKQGKPKP